MVKIMYVKTLGYTLRMARLAKNLTQDEVCNIISMNPRTLSRVENNKCLPRKSTLKQLCQVYGLHLKALNNKQEAPLD